MKRFPFNKKLVIKKSERFNEVFEQGQRVSSENLIIFFLFSSDTEIGFTVSKKIKGAVKRNRAKRRLREIFRLNPQDLPENTTIVLMAKSGAERTKFENLVNEYTDLLQKIKSKSKHDVRRQSHN